MSAPTNVKAAATVDQQEPTEQRYQRLHLPATVAGLTAALCAMTLVVVVLLSVLSGQLKYSTPALEDLQVRLYGVVVVFGQLTL